MIDWIRTYIKFVLLHRWNKVSEENLQVKKITLIFVS